MTPKGCPIFQIFQNLEFDFFGGQSIGLREYLYKIWRTCVLWLLRYQAFNFGIFLKCWLQLKLTVDIFQSSKTLFNFNREFLVKVVRGWSWYLSYYQSQNNKKNIIQVIKFYMTQREKTFDLYSELKIYRWKFNLFFLVSSMEKCNVYCKISFSSIHQTVLFLLFESM